jgi:hypothetical protein
VSYHLAVITVGRGPNDFQRIRLRRSHLYNHPGFTEWQQAPKRIWEMAMFSPGEPVSGQMRQAARGVAPQHYEKLGAALEKVVDIARAHSLRAQYRPHLATVAETPADVDRAFAHTSIGFCPDTAHSCGAALMSVR